MKKVIFILFSLLVTMNVFAKSKTDLVAEIRTEKSLTDSYKDWDITRKNIYDLSLEGGELVLFKKNNILKKVIYRLFGETWRSASEYYFKDNKLYFAYNKTERYTLVTKGNNVFWDYNNVTTLENRYYFDKNERLFRFINEKGKIIENKKGLQDAMSEFFDVRKEANFLKWK